MSNARKRRKVIRWARHINRYAHLRRVKSMSASTLGMALGTYPRSMTRAFDRVRRLGPL